MSWLLSNELSRYARYLAVGVEDKLLKVSSDRGQKPLVDYVHLENFADLVELKLNPQDQISYPISTYVGFDQEMQTTVLQMIAAGNHPEVAFMCAGVSPKKMDRWIQLGSDGIEPFHSFFIECIKASGYASAAMMKAAVEGVKGKSNTARWWLERMHPKLYGKKEVSTSISITQNTTNFNDRTAADRQSAINQTKERTPEEVLREYRARLFGDPTIIDVQPS